MGVEGDLPLQGRYGFRMATPYTQPFRSPPRKAEPSALLRQNKNLVSRGIFPYRDGTGFVWLRHILNPFDPHPAKQSLLLCFDKIRIWCRGWGSNPRPQLYECCALPLSYPDVGMTTLAFLLLCLNMLLKLLIYVRVRKRGDRHYYQQAHQEQHHP